LHLLSLPLDVRGLDDRPPFLDFGSLERAECLRCLLLARKISCPISASRARTAGSSNASFAAALSLLMTSIGVRLGAQSEYHTDA
jgi:hypothetical protein